MSYIENARRLRPIVEHAMQSVDDKTASEAAQMFPVLNGGGSLVKSGTRINWNGTVKRAAVDLWDTAENNPDNAPALWEDIDYRDGIRIIPADITATNGFAKGELGWWGDALMQSIYEGINVWTPDALPGGWEEVADGD